MKTIIKTLFVAIIFLACACHKDSVDTGVLTGRWQLTERYISAGGPGQWTPVTDQANHYVWFYSSGKLEGTVYPEYVKYAVKDSVTLTFYKSDNTLQNYRYTIKNNVLEMSPAGPIYCIEGCGNRFTK